MTDHPARCRHLAAATVLALALPATVRAQTAPQLPAQQPVSDPSVQHQELRDLRDRMTAALNRRDIGAVLAETEPDVVFTAFDNRTARGQGEVRAYFNRMLIDGGHFLKDFSFTFTPDDLSVIHGGDSAVATGSSAGHLVPAVGTAFDVAGRWTAALARDNGRWKISAFHYSVSMFDNPLLAFYRRIAWYTGIGAGAAGLLAGWLLGRRPGRRLGRRPDRQRRPA